MATQGNKMIITVDVRTGKFDSVVNESGVNAEEVHGAPTNPSETHRGDFFGTHSSPGCRTVCYRGTCYKICN